MKIIKIDLSSFSPDKQEELRQKLMSLAWDDYTTVGHPELVTIAWDRTEPIEQIFPELAQHLVYQ